MGIAYYKLFDMLARRSMKKGELAEKANISKGTMAKLTNNKVVQTDILERICKALDCQPSDIMEYIPDESRFV